jgi:uncharacterized protein
MPPGALLRDVAAGRLVVERLTAEERGMRVRLDEQHSDPGLRLADASAVILAKRFRTTRLLSFDGRGFRAVTPLGGGHFTLLPRDETRHRPNAALAR